MTAVRDALVAALAESFGNASGVAAGDMSTTVAVLAGDGSLVTRPLLFGEVADTLAPVVEALVAEGRGEEAAT